MFSMKVKVWFSTTTNPSVVQEFDILLLSFSVKVKLLFSVITYLSVLQELKVLVLCPFP